MKSLILKFCGCGLVHFFPSSTARHHESADGFAGWYWECECGSTLFLPERKAEADPEAA